VNEQIESSPGWGERDLCALIFCRPCRGLDGFGDDTHGFTVGYYLPRLRRFRLPMVALPGRSESARGLAQSKTLRVV
jgi:hypothetical protein